MAVRFRIRTSAGQELSFATREVFEDFIRSGDLSPDDLVYDSEDGSWSPSRTHPMVLEIEYEREAAEEAAQAAASEEEELAARSLEEEADESGSSFGLSLAPETESEEAAEEGLARSGPMPGQDNEPPIDEPATADEAGLGLELTAPEEVSEEEATRAFVERMEAEREASLEFGEGAGVQGFSMDDSSTLADMLAPTPEEQARPAPRPRTPPPPKKPRTPPSPSPAAQGGGGGFGRLLVIVVVLAGLGVAGFFGYQSYVGNPPVAVDPGDPVTPLPVEPEPEPIPEPVIAQTEAAIQERAQERFLTATQNALRDLLPIPDAWATGTYFSVPSEHDDAREVWGSYLTTIRTVRSEDSERYAEALETALDDAAIPEEGRGERRGRALAAFDRSAEARAAHYDRVEALASAAIQSHEALVESEGLILYEQGGSAGGRTGMGAGAYGRDEEADLLLSQVIELLTSVLDAEGQGPDDGVNVRAWVWDGFLDAATR